MSSSWNFLSWAELKGFRAELGHLDFDLKRSILLGPNKNHNQIPPIPAESKRSRAEPKTLQLEPCLSRLSSNLSLQITLCCIGFVIAKFILAKKNSITYLKEGSSKHNISEWTEYEMEAKSQFPWVKKLTWLFVKFWKFWKKEKCDGADNFHFFDENLNKTFKLSPSKYLNQGTWHLVQEWHSVCVWQKGHHLSQKRTLFFAKARVDLIMFQMSKDFWSKKNCFLRRFRQLVYLWIFMSINHGY